MRSESLELKDGIVTIQTQNLVETVDGRFLPDGPIHSVSMSAGNFASDPGNPTEEEKANFAARIPAFVERHLGKPLTDAIIDSKIMQDQITAKEQARQQAEADKARLETQLAAARAEAAQAKADLESEKAKGRE